VGSTFSTIDNTCTHVGGPLGEGELTGEVVTFPWHGAKFNVKSREVLGPPARYSVRTFPVKLQGNDVLMELD
jgi:nitrite reductase/ring-hydroxylating ferredoxin subunit